MNTERLQKYKQACLGGLLTVTEMRTMLARIAEGETMINPVQQLTTTYNVPMAHIARESGYSVRQVFRHRDASELPQRVVDTYIALFQKWGRRGSNFTATRYHQKKYGEAE